MSSSLPRNMVMKQLFLPTALGLLLTLGVTANCSNDADDCLKLNEPCGNGGSGGQGAATTTTGGSGAEGGGGTDPCGGCSAPTPLCDESTNSCVACLGDSDCTTPNAAKCDAGACVPCDSSPQCAGIPNAEVCDAGQCVACALGAEDACTAGQTCDLVAKTCVSVAPESVQNCMPCTNDLQCTDGHRCIPMEFAEAPHGYFCLEEAMPTCEQPFSVFVSRTSISGAAAVNYCGINEDLTTCEAVVALVANWRCSGIDGMCSPDGILPETSVPGALCRQVGALANRCTYACGNAGQCLDAVASPERSTCGTGMPPSSPPQWCGG
jgi:hypothetical protein